MERKQKREGLEMLILKEREQGNRWAALGCIRFKEGTQCWILLGDGEEWAIATAGKDLRWAEELLDRAWEGELSPLHLEDFSLDERRRAEIF